MRPFHDAGPCPPALILCLLCSAAVASVVTMTLVFAIIGVAGSTLYDVQEVIPQVNGSLQILRHLCAHETFRPYCN